MRRPAADGVNSTWIVHVWFGPSVAPVHVSALLMKFFGFAPTMLMPLIGRLLLVVFDTVTVCTGEAVPAGIDVTKVTLLGEKPTDDGVPLPVTVTLCVGLFGSSSWTVTVADRLPVAVGTKATLIVQLAFAASEPVAAQSESVHREVARIGPSLRRAAVRRAARCPCSEA